VREIGMGRAGKISVMMMMTMVVVKEWERDERMSRAN
jgi:hypothetical protein